MKVLHTILVMMIMSSLVFAQSKEEKEIAAAVEKLRKGMLDGDKNTLESIAAPELSYGHSTGLIEDKAAFVEALVSGKSDFTKIELTNQTIKVAGNTAIVRHELHGELSTGPVHIGILLVWQKQKNVWQLLARQAFKL